MVMSWTLTLQSFIAALPKFIDNIHYTTTSCGSPVKKFSILKFLGKDKIRFQNKGRNNT